MAIFVVSHGAWSAGWAWKKMHPLMSARGHRLITPTLTGLGERSHLARPDIDLETHIADILGVLKYEDLTGVNLIESVEQTLQDCIEHSGDNALAVIPEGPYVVPYYQPA